MGVLGNLAALVAYAAVAVAAGVALPMFVAASPLTLGVTGGALVFLAGMVLHERAARRAAVGQLTGRVLALGNLANRLREEVRELRDVQRAAAVGGDGNDEIEAMAAEMKMLKTLVAQLSSRGAAPRQPARAPARAADPMGRVEPEPLFDLGGPAEPEPAGYGYREPADPGPPDLDDDDTLLAVVRDALDEDRVDLYTQPIVSLPQRRLQFHNCVPLIRARDGRTIPPSRYLPVVERANLLGAIDNMLLFRVVQAVRKLRRRQQPISFFCAISRSTLGDRTFFADFVSYMRNNTDLASQLIFETTQHDFYRLDRESNAELGDLAKYGFRFCLRDVTNLDLFVSDLSEKGFRYVKVDAATLVQRLDRAGDPRALKRALDRGAIDLIATGIDTEARLLEMHDYAVDFGQGDLFGEPTPVMAR